MKKIVLAMFLFIETIAFAQNVTIDYKAWNPSAPPCNIFGNSTNVPASGTTSGSIAHRTRVGQPSYSTIDTAILMPTEYVTTGTVYKGTSFIIDYNFKANYTYTITINAAANSSTSTNPFIRIDRNNNAGGGGNACNGADNITASTSGNPAAAQVTSTTFTNYTFGSFVQSGNQPSLEVSAFPAQNGGFKTVVIRKITIVETPPPPTFTLNPSPTLNVPLGTSTAQNFTVTNVYNSPGVTSYEWNLGSSSNGWLLNGSPAAQNISTTTNTLTLTPADPCVILSNVSVTVKMNNTNYQTLNCSVTRSIPAANTFSISGPNDFCTSANYSIAGGSLCGATVEWSLGYLNNHPNVASLSCTTCASTTLTKLNNGTALLIATVTFPGGNVYTYEKSIGVGVPVIRGWYNSPINSAEPLAASGRFEFNWNDACLTTMINTNMDITSNSTVTWEDAGNSGGVTWNQNGNNLNFYFSNLNQWAYFRVTAANSCGSRSWLYRFRSVSENCSGGMLLRVSINPNPSTNLINVELTEKENKKKVKEILEVRITDKLGVIKQKWNFAKTGNTTLRQINISNLPSDIYTIMVFDGKTWTSEKFIKQ